MYKPIRDMLLTHRALHQTDSRRLFHGRGHLHEGLEHICIDWYYPVVLITAYDTVQKAEELVNTILECADKDLVSSVVMQERHLKGTPSHVLQGESIEETEVYEDQLKFLVRPGKHQNSGLFLDMKPLRRWLMDNSESRNILNLFAYTCSLSVAAMAGGARGATNVDMSKPSIQWGERNHEINGQDLRAVKSLPHNLFRSWGRIKQFGRYDTVIIDPPTRQRGSFDVEKNYPAILKKLGGFCHPGADVIATVNSPYLDNDYLPSLAVRYAPKLRLMGTIPASEEFADRYPERGLKIHHFQMS